MAISRVLDLGLEQSLQCWNANSKIYKVMFHESMLIPMFTRSKEPSFASRPNGYMLFSVFHCFTHFPFSFRRVCPNGGLSCLDGPCRSSILILILSFIRFRSLGAINTFSLFYTLSFQFQEGPSGRGFVLSGRAPLKFNYDSNSQFYQVQESWGYKYMLIASRNADLDYI